MRTLHDNNIQYNFSLDKQIASRCVENIHPKCQRINKYIMDLPKNGKCSCTFYTNGFIVFMKY